MGRRIPRHRRLRGPRALHARGRAAPAQHRPRLLLPHPRITGHVRTEPGPEAESHARVYTAPAAGAGGRHAECPWRIWVGRSGRGQAYPWWPRRRGQTEQAGIETIIDINEDSGVNRKWENLIRASLYQVIGMQRGVVENRKGKTRGSLTLPKHLPQLLVLPRLLATTQHGPFCSSLFCSSHATNPLSLFALVTLGRISGARRRPPDGGCWGCAAFTVCSKT